MNSEYLIYNNVNVEDNISYKNFYLNDSSKCINICNSENNCQGVSISNPICEYNNLTTQCQELKTSNEKNGIKTESLNEYNCKILNNINNNSLVLNSENNNSFIKTQIGNKINQISFTDNYYLKINDKYIGINNNLNQIFLVDYDNINYASTFKFNKSGNIIETKSNKCVQINGDYLILENCIANQPMQEFIYENKLNTIRPMEPLLHKNLCFTKSEIPGMRNISLEKCNFDNNNNQAIKTEIESYNNENFESDKFSEELNINFCTNSLYKSIVTIILFGILIYFIYYITTVDYKE